jgi:hypothetical protein
MTLDRRTGRVYVAGSASDESDTEASFFVAALRNDLSQDPAFSDDGIATTTFPGDPISPGSGVLVDRVGRLLVSGTAGRATRGAFALARYAPSGTPDRSFGTNGRRRFRTGPKVRVLPALLPQPGRRVLSLGVGKSGAGFALVRFNAG